MRYVLQEADIAAIRPPHPFSFRGAPNVFLETIKRGEFDHFKDSSSKHPTTIILRLYEAFGGHARTTLHIAEHVSISKACITNLLEDETEDLRIHREGNADNGPVAIHLDFHAFEVKTVKLEINSVHCVAEQK